MTETHFSRHEWRPGKRRRTVPRVKPYAGQKVAPPAFLAAARLNGFGVGKRRQCIAPARSTGRRCTHAAMNGSNRCHQHGGGMDIVNRRARDFISGFYGQRAKARRALVECARTKQRGQCEQNET
jgi:hypothetical protein